jgi:hypothetical protein
MNLENVHFVQYVECSNDADNLDDLYQRLFNFKDDNALINHLFTTSFL